MQPTTSSSPLSDIRVLHVFSDKGAGGAEKMMLATCAQLEKRGVFSSITCPKGSYLHRMAQSMGLTHHLLKFNGTFDIPPIIRLMKIVRDQKINILHVHQGKVFWPGIFVRWMTGGKVKVVFHRRVSMPHNRYSRRHYRYADAVIAISEAVKRVLVEQDGVATGKIRVIYNGCDFERFKPGDAGREIRKKHGIPDDAVVVGTVGQMHPPKGKGQGYLLEAVALLQKEYPGMVCLIVGTGPWENELKAIAARWGVTDRVIFSGFQENIEQYMAAMDIFTLNSWDTEGFGQVMVEAQAMGKTVIGTDVGGISETFVDGETGFLIPPEDPPALAAALRKLLDNPSQRAGMERAGVRFVREKFSLDAMTEQIITVYRDIHATASDE